jgi:rubrerythrin
MAKKYWRCTICGDLHFGENAPLNCPTCGQGRDKAIQITKEEFLKIAK